MQQGRGGFDIGIVNIADKKLTPFLATPAQEMLATFSPDGRWIAYQSDESGSVEVYVRPYPGARSEVAAVGWRRRDPRLDKGRTRTSLSRGELPKVRIMAVDVSTSRRRAPLQRAQADHRAGRGAPVGDHLFRCDRRRQSSGGAAGCRRGRAGRAPVTSSSSSTSSPKFAGRFPCSPNRLRPDSALRASSRSRRSASREGGEATAGLAEALSAKWLDYE